VSDGTLIATQDIAVTVTAINDNNPVITSNGILSIAENTMAVTTVTAVNDNNPAITSNGILSIAENTTAVITVTATDADLPAQTLTYSIVGGADAALFSINSSSGELAFSTAPDYEAPIDAGGDNIYNLTVQVSDGMLKTTQSIAVTVTDIAN
ncbi:MAG: cadherin domain-containing protein, partial [Anaerolineales bacterium]|nr:cadherin domain-containing protein [Anaerolineales bacterium]